MIKHILRKLTAISVCLLLLSIPQTQANTRNSKAGFLDFNLYPYLSDVKDDSTVTINAFSKLANGFSYFSLLNFNNQSDEDALSETLNFYTEQNVRWNISDDSPFDLTLQMNFRSGDNNDRHRLGIRWRLNDSQSLADLFNKIHMKYSINWHAIQLDDDPNYVWQMEHVFNLRFPYLTERLYLAGFVDHTFNESLQDGLPSSPIVAEAQLGYRLIENLFAVAEYRVNEYRRSDVNNLAMGIQYKIIW